MAIWFSERLWRVIGGSGSGMVTHNMFSIALCQILATLKWSNFSRGVLGYWGGGVIEICIKVLLMMTFDREIIDESAAWFTRNFQAIRLPLIIISLFILFFGQLFAVYLAVWGNWRLSCCYHFLQTISVRLLFFHTLLTCINTR